MNMTPGTVFDTPFESGCVVISTPDDFGNFTGLDSDGRECEFSVVMVLGHPKFKAPR